MRLLLKWLINALALLLVAYIIPGFDVASFSTALIFALVLGLFNLMLRPVLILLTLPITILTLGLFAFIVNGFVFWLAGRFVAGISIDGLITAVIAALLFAVAHFLGEHLLLPDKKEEE